MRARFGGWIIAAALASSACTRVEGESVPTATPCADSATAVDASTMAETAVDSSVNADAGADQGVRGPLSDAAEHVDTAPETTDVDADSFACAVQPLPIQSCGVDVCNVVVRLDYDSRAVLDYVALCEAPHAPLRTGDLATIVQTTFGLDAPTDVTMAGFDLALWHAPADVPTTVDAGAPGSVGAFMFVDRSTSAMIVGGTIETTFKGGALLFPRGPRWSTGGSWRPSCKPTHMPIAAPVYPPEGPAFGNYLAGEVVTAAWNNAIGMKYEQAYRGASSGFTAAAYRYAPTYKGTFRDWIVVVRLGSPPCP